MNIAPYIDHTLLKPDATTYQIKHLCEEAQEYGFASVCVNPYWVSHCRTFLDKTPIKICTVIGFPLGANLPEVKAYEAIEAVSRGASEIDMVINIGALKSGLPARVEDDIAIVRRAIPGVILKVIIETCLLTDSEKEVACRFAKKYGANFVKTSTGFSTGGATIEDVKLMRRIVDETTIKDVKLMRRTEGEVMGVKASGGIKDLKTALAMIEAGASRLGCSAGVAIVEEERQLQSL
ncbi:MAG: deoxyribose-phosphate aldolase [Patescibacteria group bacterium]